MGIKPLSGEDMQSLRYFYEEKGDMTRWTGWDDALPALKEYHPELLEAMRQLDIAERTLTAILRALPYTHVSED